MPVYIERDGCGLLLIGDTPLTTPTYSITDNNVVGVWWACGGRVWRVACKMSKALLKKSLAFVKSGRPEERERDSSQRKGKARSYVKEIRKKTNTAKSSAASGSNKSPPLTSDKGVKKLYLR